MKKTWTISPRTELGGSAASVEKSWREFSTEGGEVTRQEKNTVAEELVLDQVWGIGWLRWDYIFIQVFCRC